jgi:hypothetical protein
MFMWMLHDKLEKIMKYQNVYVNVTWYLKKESVIIKMFMWMLHDINLNK